MNKIQLGTSGLQVSQLALGCMRMNGLTADAAASVIAAAVDNGVDFFDHADIYGGGKSEEVFAAGIKQAGIPRDRIFLQTKCAIRQGYYDFSKAHILASVEGSLRRLGTDYVDVLLLHRPDALMEPEEVAEAFDRLHQAGKVRFFGVSNHNPMQMELLAKYLHQPIVADQLQFSPVHTGMIDCGIHVNMKTEHSVLHDGLVLDYCRLKDITIQPWSPFQHGMIEGVFLTNPAYEPVNQVLRRMAQEKGITDSAMVIAWILRHPAKMQPIVGTMNPQRIRELCRAFEVTVSREEWYEVYRAAGNSIP